METNTSIDLKEELKREDCCQTGCPGCPYFEEESTFDPNIPRELQLTSSPTQN